LILGDSLLEEIGLSSHGDELHPVEWVFGIVDFFAAEALQQTIRHILDVLVHQTSVHANQFAIQTFADEFPLDFNGTLDDRLHVSLRKLVLQHAVQQTCEVSVESLVSGDELIGKSETGHEASLFEPVDGAE